MQSRNTPKFKVISSRLFLSLFESLSNRRSTVHAEGFSFHIPEHTDESSVMIISTINGFFVKLTTEVQDAFTISSINYYVIVYVILLGIIFFILWRTTVPYYGL